MSLIFTPWQRFRARRNDAVLRAFLESAGEEAEHAFRRGMDGPKSGRIYRRRGRSHRASAPGEYPAKDTGTLYRRVKHVTTANEMTVGTTPFYARFLRAGTSKMARRKMSDDALQEAMPKARTLLGRWMEWRRG